MSALNMAEVEAFKRKIYGEDKEFIDLIEQWRETWGNLKVFYHGDLPDEGYSCSQLCDGVATLEGRIVKYVPTTDPGIRVMLEMAAEILADRSINSDSLKGSGPAFALVCHAIKGLNDRERYGPTKAAATA